MALKMNVVHKDIDMPDAYVRVERMCGRKDSMKTNISYRATADSPQMFEENIQVPLDLDGPNPFKQAYLYIKGLERFVTAKDAL